jgi:Tfp pilus assembly protein PilF
VERFYIEKAWKALKMKNIHQQMKTAVSSQKQGKIRESTRLLDEILEASPAYVPALTMRGMLHIQSQQHPAAAGKFEQVLKIEPKNHMAHENLARALMHMGQHERAREHFENAIKINPASVSRTQSDNDNDVKSTNTSLQGGASYRFSETLSGSLFAGARRTTRNRASYRFFPAAPSSASCPSLRTFPTATSAILSVAASLGHVDR